MLDRPVPQPECRVAVGPVTPGWGSWEWVGGDLLPELSPSFETTTYDWNEAPDADVVVVVKHPLADAIWRNLSANTQIIFAPIDHYGSSAEIDADRAWLKRCRRIVIHCERLRKYFAPYGAVEYIDHNVKFIGLLPMAHRPDGPILWIGVRTNLPYLAAWISRHPLLPRPLHVLTNPEDPSRPLNPAEFGFQENGRIRMDVWSEERHLDELGIASAALDIKGDDFRQRHKPPAKAIDFLAAGVPLAMNAESSSVEHLARLGFDVASPDDFTFWLSQEYWEETQRFGRVLRELLSIQRVGRRWGRIIDEVWQEARRHCRTPVESVSV